MATDKIDLSLDEIIKISRGSGSGRGRGRGRGAGRGQRGGQRGGANLRGAGGKSAAFALRGGRGTLRGSTRGVAKFNTRGRGFAKGVLRGGVQKRSRGVRQQTFTRGQVEGIWQHDLYQQSAVNQQRPTAGGDTAAARIGKLLISNLDFGVNDADIQELFAEFGTLRKAAVHYDRSGRSLGTAEVTYSMRQEAVRALNQYNNVPLDGRPMKIQLVGGSDVPITSRISAVPRGLPRGGAGMRGMGQRGRGFGGRGQRFGGQNQRFGGRGRGGRGRGRGGAGKVPSKDELDAQLDAYNAKMDTE